MTCNYPSACICLKCDVPRSEEIIPKIPSNFSEIGKQLRENEDKIIKEMSENKHDVYQLDDLIQRLEKIRDEMSGHINFPKAFYSLALEIKELKDKK